MFHVFAFTYYILLRCVTHEYSMTSVLLRDDIAIPFAIYRFHMAHSARVHYEILLDLRDARVHYYYSLLERYMKHAFVAGLVTGDFFEITSFSKFYNFIDTYISFSLFPRQMPSLQKRLWPPETGFSVFFSENTAFFEKTAK